MSEHDYSAGEAGSGGVAGVIGKAASTWIGAALSLALMTGMAVWFYRLGTRDASEIPVIRAAAGPARERPVDPGGDEAPHQDIRSYAAVEEGAVPGAVPEPRPDLAPPPPEPEAGDGPMTAAPPRARPDPVPAPPAALLPPPDAVPETSPGVVPVAPAQDVASGLTDSPAEAPAETELAALAPAAAERAPELAPAPPAAPETLPQGLAEPAPDALAAVPTVEAPEAPPETPPEAPAEALPDVPPEVPLTDTGPAPAVSPRARPRPPGLVARAEVAAATAQVAREDSVAELAAAAAASAVQVQLGAYESPEITRSMWDSVLRSHQDVLTGRTLSVQSTVSGGKTWYRLRVGPFRDAAEARNVCAALQARGQDCIVARNG